MRIMSSDSVAYLGVEGSYSHQVARLLFPRAQAQNFRSFGEVIESVQTRACNVAVVPVENSIAGRVADVHGLLLQMELMIAQERLLKIDHCLIVRLDRFKNAPNIDAASIKKVVSHPQALTQCRGFLSKNLPGVETVSATDTASAVKSVCEDLQTDIAAIGSASAARLYGGYVLAEDIADVHTNTTRFLVLSNPDNLEDDPDDNMTSLIFQVDHQPGSLIRALRAFEDHGINLTKLETYMVSEEVSRPTFYVDVGASLSDERTDRALRQLRESTTYLKLLGTYQADKTRTGANGFLPI